MTTNGAQGPTFHDLTNSTSSYTTCLRSFSNIKATSDQLEFSNMSDLTLPISFASPPESIFDAEPAISIDSPENQTKDDSALAAKSLATERLLLESGNQYHQPRLTYHSLIRSTDRCGNINSRRFSRSSRTTDALKSPSPGAYTRNVTTSNENSSICGARSQGLEIPYHWRSLSLNDLDRALVVRLRRPQKPAHHSSSSSGQILKAILAEASYPLHPSYPAPERCSTPSGLPSFGTIEAQELRLIPSVRPEWLDTLMKRLQRHSQTLEEDAWEERQMTRLAEGNSIRRPSADPRDNLRRLLGMSRLVTVPTNANIHQRSSLPPGIRVASVPGALTRAEDGSMIRGRFGVRASGHGVGPRAIDAHPLSQTSRAINHDQAARETEKTVQHGGAQAAMRHTTRFAESTEPLANENLSRFQQGRPALRVGRSAAAKTLQAERRAIQALEDARTENRQLSSALAVVQSQPQRPVSDTPSLNTMLSAPYRTPSPAVRHPSRYDAPDLTSRPRQNTHRSWRPSWTDGRPSPHVMAEPGPYMTQTRLDHGSEVSRYEQGLRNTQQAGQHARHNFQQRKSLNTICGTCHQWLCSVCFCCWSPTAMTENQQTISSRSNT